MRHASPALFLLIGLTASAAPACRVQSGPTVTPVIELYTSEGCSSCPPADRWLSAQRGSPAVLQAFHVGYWDAIGWPDRFADASHTTRQRERARANGLLQIYTPQVLHNGVDWPQWRTRAAPPPGQARVQIELARGAAADAFEARVTPQPGVGPWQAWWTVTEDGHATRVRAGENAGAHLRHDAVVRQYRPAGTHEGAATLRLDAPPATPGHARRINLVVTTPGEGALLQALSLPCD
ncbi:MAG: DUF1223 domain-containing protein [Rubrivivax sp.]